MISKIKLDTLWSTHATFESRIPKKLFERARMGVREGKLVISAK